MATIAQITNLVNCSLASVYGTGSKGCKAFFKNVSSVWLTERGFKFDPAEVLDETYIQLLQAQGKLIILKGTTGFTDNSEDTVIETLEDGTKQVIRKGLYEFGFEFIGGIYYQQALNSLNSFQQYDLSLVDSANNILNTLAEDGSVKGLSTTMIQVGGLTFATGSVGLKNGLTIQLEDADEIDDTFSFISGASLAPYRPKNADGVNEVSLVYNTAPADSATTLVVKATLKQGGGIFAGALIGNFLIKVNGATVTPSAIAEASGVYTLTIAAIATNEVVTVDLYNVADSREGIILDGAVYKSNTITATVVA